MTMDSELDQTVTNISDTLLNNNNIDNSSKWARLISINPTLPHIEIENDECTFGRARSCDVKYDDKRISSSHCKIYRKKESPEADYRFFIDDTSSNGTFVNRKRVGKGTSVSLVNGNEIAFTTTIDPNDNTRIIYIFQDLEKMRREEEEERKKQEEERLRLEEEERKRKEEEEKEKMADEPGNTQILDDSDVQEIPELSPIKSKQSSTGSINNDTDTDMTPTTPSKLTKTATTLDSTAQQTTPTKQPSKTTISPSSTTISSDNTTKNSSNISPANSSLSQPITTTTTTTTTDPATDDNNNNNNTTTTNPTTLVKSNTSTIKRKSSDLGTGSTADKKAKIEVDSMEENLICGICQEIIYKCVTLIPCMHNFCACCYGDWRENSSICPQCRSTVKCGQKNHAINNLIESYVKANPSKKRDPEELKEMDTRSKITDEMLQNGKLNKIKNNEYYDDEDDYDEDGMDGEYDDEDEDEYQPVYFAPLPDKCYFCTNPTPSGYKCPEIQPPHQFCSGCSQKFPLITPPQVKDKCDLCKKPFCNNFRLCQGHSRVNNLVDQVMTEIPYNSFSGNQYEIKILSDYIAKSHKTIDGVYHEVVADIESGKIPADSIKTLYPNTPVKSDSWTCYQCARHVFAQGLFTYRKNIPKEELPDYAQSRENCYYGKNCRTQLNKFDHAKKLNHVCEQSRF